MIEDVDVELFIADMTEELEFISLEEDKAGQ